MNPKALAGAAAILAVGIAIGFFFGRATLEAEWSKTTRLLSPSEAGRAGADAPPVGSRVLVSAPLRRARLALGAFTKDDPVVVTVGSFGRGEDTSGDGLNLALENRGKCTVTRVRGVVYPYAAWGVPTPIERGAPVIRGFTADKQRIAPGETAQVFVRIETDNVASVLLGHIDAVECEGGTRWSRPAG